MPQLESFAVELKVMILKGMTPNALQSAISASPGFLGAYLSNRTHILETITHSLVSPEIEREALAVFRYPKIKLVTCTPF